MSDNDVEQEVKKLNGILAKLPKLSPASLKKALGQEVERVVIRGGNCENKNPLNNRLVFDVRLAAKKKR